MKYNKPGVVALCLTLTGATAFHVCAQTTPKKLGAKQTKPAAKKTATEAKKTATEAKYRAHCGMIYSASDAKKYHYVCPMDHKPLTKIAANAKYGGTVPVK